MEEPPKGAVSGPIADTAEELQKGNSQEALCSPRRLSVACQGASRCNRCTPNKGTAHFLTAGIKRISLQTQVLSLRVYSILIIIDPFAQLKRPWITLKYLNGPACVPRVTEL